MSTTINIFGSKRNLFFAGLLWILVWTIPWGNLQTNYQNLYLAFLVDMIRLGIALGVFIVPGALLYILLGDDDLPSARMGILPGGFTLSVFMIAVIGLVARLAGFSFDLVRNIFALIGMVELVWVLIFKSAVVPTKDFLQKSFRSIMPNSPLLFALIIATAMTFHNYLLFIDDTSYLAYLTNWQHSDQLGFMNIVHQVNLVENVRFWLALYPMGQALLSDLSGVPGILLLGSYLELFLVPIAVITSYWFACTLGLSKRAAGFSVLIQVSLYTWMLGEDFPVGMWFYENMAEDKVSAAFIMAPVFLASVICALRSPTKGNLSLVLLTGIGLTLTHPITLFFTCTIASALALFSWVVHKTKWRLILQLVITFIVAMAPYILVRFSSIPVQTGMPFNGAQASTTFQPSRYVNIVSNVFYGMNPGVLKFIDLKPDLTSTGGYTAFQVFRSTPIILAAFAGLIALINYKKGPLYWYILACVLLVFFAAVPYTGWLVGQLVSARVVPRASWFSPLGLSGVLILKLLNNWLRSRHVIDEAGRLQWFKKLNLTTDLLGVSIFFVFAAPMVAYNLFFHGLGYSQNLDKYQQLAQVGAYIDKNTNGPVTNIALDYTSTQLLPGVSAHTVLISFREETPRNGFNGSFSLGEIRARTYASNAIRSLEPTSSATERCFFLQKFNVKFVVAYTDNAEPYTRLLNKCGIAATRAFMTKNMVLLELK